MLQSENFRTEEDIEEETEKFNCCNTCDSFYLRAKYDQRS